VGHYFKYINIQEVEFRNPHNTFNGRSRRSMRKNSYTSRRKT